MKLVALAYLLTFLSSVALAQEYNGERRRKHIGSTDRIIVKWKDSAERLTSGEKALALSSKTRIKLETREHVASRMDVLQLERKMPVAELQATLEALTADPAVEFAAPDLRRHAHALPNDALVSSQWSLLSNEVSALRAEAAWDLTTGSGGTVVAVLDTGVRYDHPDLQPAAQGGKLLPGYDFVSGESVSSFLAANDGDGRDSDPSDPGDWVSNSDLSSSVFSDCETNNSSWHGTRVAGVIAARTGNNEGMAGVAWNAWILPVRVLGKCGGRDSDIMAAMRWAAGLDVPGVPSNPYPAKVINLSLGGEGICTSAYQSVASELSARGVLIVASAGNEGGTVSAPANCDGVLGVTGVRHIGTKVGFSNLGPSVGIAAPGGNCVNFGGGPCLFSIITATNLGQTIPAGSSYTDQTNFNVGTSFSAPLVAGTAALMHAVNGRLGTQQLISRLQQGASPFPVNPDTAATPTCHVPAASDDIQDAECYCTTSTCGAGLLNAQGAVTNALRPAAVLRVSGTIAPGQAVTLDASSSIAACGRQISSFEWIVLSPTNNSPALSSTNQAATVVLAPTSGEAVIRVTVLDDAGAQDSAEVTISPTKVSMATLPLVAAPACPTPIVIAQTPATPPSPSPTPSAPRSSGRGGGEVGWQLLLVLGLVGLLRRKLHNQADLARSRRLLHPGSASLNSEEGCKP